MKKLIALILVAIMLFTMLPMTTIAANEDVARISIDSTDAVPGETISVNVNLENNPGIVSANISVSFDDGLTLIGAVNGSAFPKSMSYIPPKQLSTIGKVNSNCNFAWQGTDIADEDIKDGTILTLQFEVSEEAEIGDIYYINITSRSSDIVDKNLQPVDLAATQGKITIIDYTPGDVNDDGVISMMDTVMISRYIVDGCTYDPNGYAIQINDSAADVNDDGTISMLDAVMVSRYIVDGCKTDPNGYNITLKSVTKKCVHSMEAFEAVEATCTEDGNIAYWHCTKCGKYFADENGNTVISVSDTIINATGHNPVVDPYVEPTETTEGLTEGSHCSECGIVLVPQEPIPPIEVETYSIVYHLWDNETDYLKTVELENINPVQQNCSKTLRLQPLDDEGLGFNFKGWFILGEEKPTNTIDANTIEDGETIHLYAKWDKVVYTVQFETNLVPVEEETYTVDKDKTLPSDAQVHVDGYIFAGWSDENGDIITRIPKGTVGDKVFTANYISERNQAWTKNKLDAPIVIEDEETNTILFTYEIGEIRNVPLYVINDFGKINASGVSQTVTKTFSTTISESLMNNYTNTVAKAVTDSYGVTLSNGWSDSTSIDETWAKENGMTSQETEEYCKSDTSGWYVSSGKSGSSTSSTTSTTDSYNLNTSTNNAKISGSQSGTVGSSSTAEVDARLSANISNETTVGGSLGVDVPGVGNVGGSASNTTTVGLGAEVGAKYSDTQSASRTDSVSGEVGAGNSIQTGSISHTGSSSSSTSGWNTESGKNASSTVSQSASVSKALSEKVTEAYGYGKEYITTGSESSNQTKTASQTDTEQYSNTVTYSKATTETETVTFTTTNTASGYHRWIMAGTAHVFAIVGYDIASKSYFISTYSVMDDEMHRFEDYSYSTAAYNDNQNGQISFEIPSAINEYVAKRVCETEGLEVNKNGVITNYIGTADYVIIPEYKVIENLDGTTQVIKVVGISETAFQNNKEIVAVELSDYITAIPNNAFKNCTSLKFVGGIGITSIGDYAFSGCTSLPKAKIGDTITSIGIGAFDSVSAFSVNAANSNVVDAAVSSGAKEINVIISDKCGSLDGKTLTIGKTTETFVFGGMGKAYTNLVIDSNATEKTAIYRTNVTSSVSTPVIVNSKILELDDCSFNAPGIALKILYDSCNVKLYGETTLDSTSGKALLCKDITVGQIKSDFESKITVNGDVLICGHIRTEGRSYLDVVHTEHIDCDDKDYVKCGGVINHISEEEFNKYVVGTFKVSFNANGGSVGTSPITAQYGCALGTLPTPTRENYVFDGWFTEESGGDLVTSASVPEDVRDITVYAHWTLNTYTLSFNANGGSVSETSRTATCNTGIGTLPIPTRDYYSFDGWYTAASGGTAVSSSSIFNTATTIYAHWTIHSPIGWVKASEVPSGAQIVERKYSYTQRSYTSSSASSLSGWTKYDTQRTSWGSTQGPVYSDPSNGSRNVWSEKYVTSSNYKTVYCYYRYAANRTGGNGAPGKSSSYPNYYTFEFNSPLEKTTNVTFGGKSWSRWKYWYSSSNWVGVYGESTKQVWVSDNYGTRWYYQEPVYTYYYYKDENKESGSYPSGSNISNIVEWVKYRAK